MGSHIGFEFEAPIAGLNLVMRPEHGDLELKTEVGCNGLPDDFTVVAHGGFLGNTETDNSTTIELAAESGWTFIPWIDPIAEEPVEHAIRTHDSVTDEPQPMKEFRFDFSSDFASRYVKIQPSLTGDAHDLTSPPAFFGIRVVPLTR